MGEGGVDLMKWWTVEGARGARGGWREKQGGPGAGEERKTRSDVAENLVLGGNQSVNVGK